MVELKIRICGFGLRAETPRRDALPARPLARSASVKNGSPTCSRPTLPAPCRTSPRSCFRLYANGQAESSALRSCRSTALRSPSFSMGEDRPAILPGRCPHASLRKIDLILTRRLHSQGMLARKLEACGSQLSHDQPRPQGLGRSVMHLCTAALHKPQESPQPKDRHT